MSKKTLLLSTAAALFIQWVMAVEQPSFTSEHMSKEPEQSTIVTVITLINLFEEGAFQTKYLEKMGIKEDQVELLINEDTELVDSMYELRAHPLGAAPAFGSLLAGIVNHEYFLKRAQRITDDEDEDEDGRHFFSEDYDECHIPESFASEEEMRHFLINDENCSFRQLFTYIRQSSDTELVSMSEAMLVDFIKGLIGATKQSISLRLMLSSGQDDLTEKALSFLDTMPFTFIGMANYDGIFSGHFRMIDEKYNQKLNIFVVPLNERLLKNEQLLSSMDGIIIPGAGDSFHSAPNYLTKPFGLEQLDSEAMMDHEKIYQWLYDYSMREGIPVLGTCAGNQHLALNKGGMLSRLTDAFDGHKQVKLVPGSLNHYMALSSEAQSDALNHCDLPEVVVNGTVMHSYVIEQVANGVEIAGLTTEQPENVIMAASYKGHISTFQFHPEYVYDPRDEQKDDDPNTHIIESFVKFTAAHRAMRRQSQAPYYAPAMHQRAERLKQCASNSKKALGRAEYWFNGDRGSESLNIQPEHNEVTVYVAPGLLSEDLDIQQSYDSMRIFISHKDSGSSMEFVKSRANQKVHIEYTEECGLN
ncbi:glutamine amidotransferase-related protein [Endozoicomonas numazuensis]|uniref:Glutamine amidotransferase domain-containing protein n=1 Tax=Endozoicomonas numazuensis TaxID=1137799 RepID=A0A081N6P5_9GAMM|nr:gamma-glutamyl-gamma-aminobutyrate hydrolase family protein [Endozoicomonas numazuensis]KEQ14118.1 hypothetical protein GZ78_26250 [Endozoicomonas numazuensis]